jgi:hypothetical protein
MAIVRESATLSSNTENNVCTVNMPSTRPDGDLYICLLCKDDTSNVTDPAGWNEIVNGDVGTGAGYIGWRFGSSEPATYSFTHSGSSESWNGVVIRYSGVKPTTPFGSQTITPGGNAGSGAVTAAFPVITAETADSKILRLCFTDTVVATGYSTGSGTFVTVNTTAGTGWSCIGFGEENSPGASTNTPATTFSLNTAGDNGVVTLELLAATSTGDMTSVGALAFTTASDLDATGTLAVTDASAFAGIADLDATGNVVAVGALAFTTAAVLSGGVNHDITAVGAVSFTSAADLDATGALAVTDASAFAGIADLDATGTLAGLAALTWTSADEIVFSHVFVELTSINSESDYRITATPDLEIGDHLEARAVGGGAAPDGLTLNPDATFSYSGAVQPFDVRVWDSNDGTWGAWATQTVGLLATGSITLVGIASLNATGTLAVTDASAFAAIADLDAPGTLAATDATVFAGIADLDAAGNLLAVGAPAFTATADLDAVGAMGAVGSIVWTDSAGLTAVDAEDLLAVGAITWASAADLDAVGAMGAVGTLAFTGTWRAPSRSGNRCRIRFKRTSRGYCKVS